MDRSAAQFLRSVLIWQEASRVSELRFQFSIRWTQHGITWYAARKKENTWSFVKIGNVLWGSHDKDGSIL